MGATIIGISCSVRAKENEFVHELQDRYVRAIKSAGGLAVALPRLDASDAKLLARFLDGVLISGGHDIPPDFYGADPHPATQTDEAMRERVEFEISLVKAMAELGKPVLGICHGCQLINVAFGGTLVQDIPSQWANPLPHRLPDRPWFVEHEVEIKVGSLLWEWLQVPRITVKSAHHQAVQKIGQGLQVVAWASDGIVEAVEAIDGKPIVGVQWHPEAQMEAEHARKLFSAFVRACGEAKLTPTRRT